MLSVQCPTVVIAVKDADPPVVTTADPLNPVETDSSNGASALSPGLAMSWPVSLGVALLALVL